MPADKTLSEREAYDELAYYTLEHARTDPSFIHQYIVDAYAAQHANAKSKPITVAFALIGLYLHLEKEYSGKKVQEAHMQLAKQRKQWPVFPLPEKRGEMTALDVLKAPPGAARDEAIREWSRSVWAAWHASHKAIAELVQAELGRTQ